MFRVMVLCNIAICQMKHIVFWWVRSSIDRVVRPQASYPAGLLIRRQKSKLHLHQTDR
jgi:hypothetical protein